MLAANRAFYDAFTACDLEAMEHCWGDGEEVCCVHPGGPLLRGWPVVRASWEALLDGARDVVMDVEVASVTVEDPVAWLTCLERMATLGHGGRAGAQVIATNVFVLGPAGWRMVLHHASPVLP